MEERINIWGKNGCSLPNGKLCNACCILPEVELEGTIVSVKKPGFSPCPNLSKDGQGCSLHLKGNKPAACSWHCSQANTEHKLELIAQTLSSGSISLVDANLAIANLIKDTGNRVPLPCVIEDVYQNSEIIRKNTKTRELVCGDLDEP